MHKFIFNIGLVVSIFILTSCSTFEIANVVTEQEIIPSIQEATHAQISSRIEILEYAPEPTFVVRSIDDEFLNQIEDYLAIDYSQSRGGFVTSGSTILFSFDESVRSFRLLGLERLECGQIVQTEIIAEIQEIDPAISVVFTNYVTLSGVITSGFYFETEYGTHHFYLLEQNERDGQINFESISLTGDEVCEYIITEINE